MQVRKTIIMAVIILAGIPLVSNAQRPTRDKEKERQWKSMENGPWDFAPDW